MSEKGNYLAFAVEHYRYAKGLSGTDVWSLFKRYELDRYVMDSFDLFHIESEWNMIDAVDDRIAKLGGIVPETVHPREVAEGPKPADRK